AERDPGPDTTPLPAMEPAERPSPMKLLREGVAHEMRRQLGIVRRTAASVPGAAGDVPSAARGTAEVLQSLVRMLAPARTPLSPIMTERSLSVRFDVLSAPLGETKAAANRVGARLNDAFVAAVAGGLGRYHRRNGTDVDALRMSMPINIRTAESETLGGNQFVPARFPVPMTIADPAERMASIRDLVATQKAEPALALTMPIAGVLNRLPTTLVTGLFGGMLKGVDFVTSNVPGAPFEVFLAGAKVEANFALGPLAGAAINITLLSYLDELQVGVNSDPAAVPDPEVLMECLAEGFEEIRKA